MPKRTTLAEILTHVIAKLERAIPPNGPNAPTLLQAWTNVLGGNGRHALDVVSSIGQISSTIIKLESQVKESERLTGDEKRLAQDTLENIKKLFEVHRFHVSSFEFRNSCNYKERGTLGIIGHALETEFSEPKLEESDAEQLIAELKELRDIVAKSNISLDLRINLFKHVDTMLWWLSHPEMASVQDIFESVGSALVISKQIEQRYEKDDDKKDDSKEIFKKTSDIADRLYKITTVVNLAYQTGFFLATEAQKYIGS